MLPSELLRARTSRGSIRPMFCPVGDADAAPAAGEKSAELLLASDVISAFEDARKKGATRGELHGTLAEMEPGRDYKLVRGLGALLERRSSFAMRRTPAGKAGRSASPYEMRRAVFEASSRMGLATSDAARDRIIQAASLACGIPDAGDVSGLLWADLDENHVIEGFDAISACDLLLWYNMSLAQTLLFRCVRLEFSIRGGHEWKSVLRAVKMQGLMYDLEYGDTDGGRSATDDDVESHGRDGPNRPGARGKSVTPDTPVRCTVEGPLSIFKMTTRYGTAFARLLPFIARTPCWEIDATISKSTVSGPKLYRFELSGKTAANYLRAVSGAPGGSDAGGGEGPGESYDSSVEQKFADILRQHLDQNEHLGWRLIREPGPLVAGRKAMLPDFALERLGHVVYLEIVGFWTPDYIKRKIAKLREIMDMQGDGGHDDVGSPEQGGGPGRDSQNLHTQGPAPRAADMLVGIDSSLLCSQASELRGAPGVFEFGRHISVKPVLDHLRKIDAEMEARAASTAQIPPGDLDGRHVLAVRDLALKYGVPERVVPSVVAKSSPGSHVKAGPYMISAERISQVSGMLEGMRGFADACDAMDGAGIPAESHADALSLAGYDVIWKDLDPKNASILKRDGPPAG